MNRLRTATAACALVAITSCSSRPDPGPTVSSTTRQTIAFGEDGTATRDLEIAIAVSGSGPEHHVGLDDVTVPGWSVDAIEVVESDWPIVVEGEEDKVVRTIHVRASASFVNGAAHEIVPATVRLVGDEGPLDVGSGFADDDQTFDPCTNLAVDAIAAQLGLTVLARATTTPGAIAQPIDIAATADGAWVLGLADVGSVLRLVRMRDGGTFLPKELAGFQGSLEGGASGSVVVATQGDIENQLVRYDGEANKTWSHRVLGDGGELPRVAVAGGHVLVDVVGNFVTVDSVTLPTSSLGATRILFDEVTGELLSSSDTAISYALLGLSDGAFAAAANGQVMVLEADLTPRWAVDLQTLTLPIRLAENGNKLWVASSQTAEPLDLATGAAAGATINTPNDVSMAPLPDGSVLFGVAFGTLGRVAPDGTTTFVSLEAPAPWCAPTSGGFASSFPGGGAFALSLTHTDQSLPGFGKPLPALIGVVAP